MKSIAKKSLIIVMVVVSTALIAFCKSPHASIVPANGGYHFPGYEPLEIRYPAHQTCQHMLF